MGLKWLSRHEPRVDPKELSRLAEESLTETRGKQPHVNALTSYLNNRTGENGFGEDFEITLIPRRAL